MSRQGPTRLVVDCKTNPEIAAELFLSQNTVGTHRRNILHKIDVSSRVELARVVEHADHGARNFALVLSAEVTDIRVGGSTNQGAGSG